MAYCIHLTGPAFDHDGWVEDLGTCGLPISPMGSQIAELSANNQSEEMWLHPIGGLRGVTVRRTAHGADLSLPAGVTENDFLLAGTLVRAAKVRGAQAVDEEGVEITGSEQQMKDLGEKQRRFNWSAISHQLEQGTITLPVGGILPISIEPSERIDARWDTLERVQLEKMKRYEQAFVASLMRGSFNGLHKHFSNYHHQPTLIRGDADWVLLNGEHGDITNGVPVAMEQLRKILEGRLETLGDWTFVPAIDFSKEPELAAALKKAAGPPPPNAKIPGTPPGKPADISLEELTGQDWMLMAKMTVFCCYMVAAADGNVDSKELKTVGNILQQHQSCPYPALTKILGIAHSSMETIGNELTSEAMHPLLGIALLKATLDKFPQDQASQIREGILKIAQAVAESSGGIFGFGSKVSKKEQAVLDLLRSALA